MLLRLIPVAAGISVLGILQGKISLVMQFLGAMFYYIAFLAFLLLAIILFAPGYFLKLLEESEREPPAAKNKLASQLQLQGQRSTRVRSRWGVKENSAVSALTKLGFKKTDAKQAVMRVPGRDSLTLQELVKEALQKSKGGINP